MFGLGKSDSRRLRELEERIETLERGWKALQLDWEDLYDKVRRAMQRTAKRAEIVERAEAEAGNGGGSPLTPEVPGSGIGLDPISQAIRQRRARALGRFGAAKEG